MQFKHFKGGVYEIVDVARDADSHDKIVVYKDSNNKVWCRSYSDFISEVDHDKYPDIKQKYRFETAPLKEVPGITCMRCGSKVEIRENGLIYCTNGCWAKKLKAANYDPFCKHCNSPLLANSLNSLIYNNYIITICSNPNCPETYVEKINNHIYLIFGQRRIRITRKLLFHEILVSLDKNSYGIQFEYSVWKFQRKPLWYKFFLDVCNQYNLKF